MQQIKKTIGLILVLTFIYSLLMWYFSDSIGPWGTTANPILIVIVNAVTNPIYLGFLLFLIIHSFTVFKLNKNSLNYLKVTIAAIIFALAIDILSPIHSFDINYTLPQSTNVISIYSDTLLGSLLAPILQPMKQLGTFILYVVIPFLLVIISLLIVHTKGFLQIFNNTAGQHNEP